ncbi:MAG: hypothetical protein U9R24_00415 [Thermodesulfobacteriota bacterium]|nr:hypothetical protein [Thermodesulfobacteriota bacterium]
MLVTNESGIGIEIINITINQDGIAVLVGEAVVSPPQTKLIIIPFFDYRLKPSYFQMEVCHDI